jgi:hypothetical protein
MNESQGLSGCLEDLSLNIVVFKIKDTTFKNNKVGCLIAKFKQNLDI